MIDSNIPPWLKFRLAEAVGYLLPYAEKPEVLEFLREVAVDVTKFDRATMSRKTRYLEYYPNGLVKLRGHAVGMLPEYTPEDKKVSKPRNSLAIYRKYMPRGHTITLEVVRYMDTGILPKASRPMFIDDMWEMALEKEKQVREVLDSGFDEGMKVFNFDTEKNQRWIYSRSYTIASNVINLVLHGTGRKSNTIVAYNPPVIIIPVEKDAMSFSRYKLALETDSESYSGVDSEDLHTHVDPGNIAYNSDSKEKTVVYSTLNSIRKTGENLAKELKELNEKISGEDYAALRKVLHAKKIIRNRQEEPGSDNRENTKSCGKGRGRGKSKAPEVC